MTKETEGTVDTETQGGADDESVAETPEFDGDLTDLPQFRKYQSTMEQKLQKALGRTQEYEEQLTTLTDQLEALKAGREYDESAVQEIHQMMTRQRETRQHVKALRDTWGHLGLNEDASPKTVAQLAEAETKEEADTIVFNWINDTVESARGESMDEDARERQELDESGVDESPIPAATGGADPDSVSELTRRMRERVQETGKSALGDWLQATEPHFRTRANRREGRQSKL